jgi:hypothetical protein
MDDYKRAEIDALRMAVRGVNTTAFGHAPQFEDGFFNL